MSLGVYYWQLFASRWKLVCGLVLGCGFAAWLFSVAVLAQRPDFEAAARLNIVPTSEELGFATRFVRGSTFDGGSVMVQTYAEYARTRPVVDPVIDAYIGWEARRAGQSKQAWINANSVPGFYTPGQILALLNYGEVPKVPLREDLAQSLLEATTIETVEGTYLLRIAVEWDDPQAAAWLANALSDAVVTRAQNQSARAGSKLTDTLETSLQKKQTELASLLARSRRLKQAVDVVDLDQQKQALLQELMAEQGRLTSDKSALDAATGQVSGLKRQATGKLSSSQQAVEQALALEGPKAEGLRGGMAVREQRIAQLRAQFERMSNSEQSIKQLDDQIALVRRDLEALADRVSFNRNENLANAPKIEVIERASVPLVRSSPKILFNTIIGLIAGAALAGAALLLVGPGKPRKARALPDAPDGKSRPAFSNDDDDALPYAGNVAAIQPEAPSRIMTAQPTDVSGGARGRAPYGRATALAVNLMDEPEGVHQASVVTEGSQIFYNLPQPAGVLYSADECEAVLAELSPLLEDAEVWSGRPVLVLASGNDNDARAVHELLLHDAAAKGLAVLPIDATADHCLLQTIDSGALVYGGGLLQSAKPEQFVLLGDVVVLAVVPSTISTQEDWLEELSDAIFRLAGSRPLLLGMRHPAKASPDLLS